MPVAPFVRFFSRPFSQPTAVPLEMAPPPLAEVLKGAESVVERNATHAVVRYRHNGQALIYKRFLPVRGRYGSLPRRIRKSVDAIFHRFNHCQRHRRWFGPDSSRHEAHVLGRWRGEGVRTPEVLEVTDDLIVIRAAPGRTLEKCLKDDNAVEVATAFGKTFQSIRAVAIRHGDAGLLHTDPMPRNFIFDRSSGTVSAIDPGSPLKSVVELDQIDGPLMLLAAYGIASVVDRSEALDDLLLAFFAAFPRPGREALQRLNRPVFPPSRVYQHLSRRWLLRMAGSGRISLRFDVATTDAIDRCLRQLADRE